MECASPKPPLSGEVARRNAETERSYQICSNLSVSLRLTAPYPFCPFGTFPPDRGNRPLRGEPFPRRRVTPQALRASSP